MHLASANPKDLVEKQHYDSRRLTGWGVLLAASVFSCLCVRASGAEAKPALRLGAQGYFEAPGIDVMVVPGRLSGRTPGRSRDHPERSPGRHERRSCGWSRRPGQWAPVPVQLASRRRPRGGADLGHAGLPRPCQGQEGIQPHRVSRSAPHVHGEGARRRDPRCGSSWISRAPLPSGVGRPRGLQPRALSRSRCSGRAGTSIDAPASSHDSRTVPCGLDERRQVQPRSLREREAAGDRAGERPPAPGDRERPGRATASRREDQPPERLVRRPIPGARRSDGGCGRMARDAPARLAGWRYGPVVHVSQVGYHPAQPKVAVIERDAADQRSGPAALLQDRGGRASASGCSRRSPRVWGPFLRYQYLQFDFSRGRGRGDLRRRIRRFPHRALPHRPRRVQAGRLAADPGVLPAGADVPHASRGEVPRVARPVSHGRRPDGADERRPLRRLSPGGDAPSRSTRQGSPVPGLNAGGWHDAGDDDLRVESQAGEVYVLALAYEAFGPRLDSTTVDQRKRLVGIRRARRNPRHRCSRSSTGP